MYSQKFSNDGSVVGAIKRLTVHTRGYCNVTMNSSLFFNGKNKVRGLPDDLCRVVTFLLEKDASGSFCYSDRIEDWEDVASVIEKPLDLSYRCHELAAAVGLAYLASLCGGNIKFSDKINQWEYAHALLSFVQFSGWDAVTLSNVVGSFNSDEDIRCLLGAAVREYSCAYFDEGLDLIERQPDYKRYICAGLLQSDYERYCQLFPPRDNQLLFVRAMLSARLLELEYMCKAYDVSKDFALSDTSEMMSLLLKFADVVDKSRGEVCKERVLYMLSSAASKYVHPLTNWMRQHSKADSFLKECLYALIKGLDEKSRDAALKIVDNATYVFRADSEFLIDLLYFLADTQGVMSILKLEHTIQHLSHDGEGFLEMVLSLILHPKGLYRVVGRRLWDDYHLEICSFDLSSLPELGQMAFVENMLEDFGNPETRLPKILPLLYSDSKKVLAVLVDSLKNYTDEYMGHVTKCLDDLKINTEIAESIRHYVSQRYTSITKRRNIKELSPLYSQHRYFAEAQRVEMEHIREVMVECEKNSPCSFADFSKKEVLARGGGWRDEGGRTTHLASIQVSVPARIMEQSMMPVERRKWMNQLLRDYEPKTGNS